MEDNLTLTNYASAAIANLTTAYDGGTASPEETRSTFGRTGAPGGWSAAKCPEGMEAPPEGGALFN